MNPINTLYVKVGFLSKSFMIVIPELNKSLTIDSRLNRGIMFSFQFPKAHFLKSILYCKHFHEWGETTIFTMKVEMYLSYNVDTCILYY